MRKILLATAAFALAGSANAAVSITSTAFDGPLAPGEQLVVTFDAPNAPGYSISGGATMIGSVSGVSAAPAGDATRYMYVLGGTSAIFRSTRPLLQVLCFSLENLVQQPVQAAGQQHRRR